MTPAKRVIKKFSLFFLAAILTLTPLNGVFLFKVQAEPVWDNLVSFGEDFYSITKIVEGNDRIYFTTNGSEDEAKFGVYEYYDGEYTRISDSLILDETSTDIADIAYANGVLYVVVHYFPIGFKVFEYDEEWTDVSEEFEELYYIDKIGTIGDKLYIWGQQIYDIDEELYSVFMYSYDGETLETKSDVETFSDYDSSNFSLNKIIPVGSDTGIFVFFDWINEEAVVFGLEDDEWTILWELENYYISDAILKGSEVYFIASDFEWVNSFSLYKMTSFSDVEIIASNGFGNEGLFEGVLALINNDLYLGASSPYGGDGILFKSINGSEWSVESEFIGELTEVVEDKNSWVTSMLGVGNNLYVASGIAGEGPVEPSLWSYQLDEEDSSEEDNGPNNGDANNDGVPDSEQQNVTSYVSTLTSNYVVLESDCTTNISSNMVDSSELGTDSSFSYPEGLMNFELECEEGFTATVKQYYYSDINESLVQFRKHINDEFVLMENAEAENIIIDGLDVLVITFQITDGGEFDVDGIENGIIIDPSGPALFSVGVPNTGLGGLPMSV